ncbi:MAG: Rieske 2Fe-2S domain-containing protein [Bacillota bacterium]|nr:Rieske 2Fe-2S domain-containing protein [Bacillota bacterium]
MSVQPEAEKPSAQPKPAPEPEKVSRRRLLRYLMWGSTGVFTLAVAGTGLGMFWPRKIEGFGGKVVAGPVSKFAQPLSVTVVREGKFYVSHVTRKYAPTEGLIALYWRCVHLGCTVPWVPAEDRFHCPCHGSIYDHAGKNIAGPAPRPLDWMPLTIEKGIVVVDTGKINQRHAVEADQITPLNG